MNVLWITQNRPDGISVGRRLVADHLRERGVAVDQTPARPATLLRYLPRAGEYDAIVGTTEAGALLAVVLATVGRTALVVDDIDETEQFRWKIPTPLWWALVGLETVAFRRADHVLYVYDGERERVQRYASAYTRTDFGVDYDRFADPTDEVLAGAGERLAAVVPDGRVAVYVGGLEPPYNVRPMVEAFDHLAGWHLVVAGAGSMADYVAEAAEERENVHFLGTVPHEEVPGLLHHADVGLCLVDDARTLKVLEYMAAGLPTVHLDGAARDRFGDLLVYTGTDPRDVADAVRRASADPPDTAALREFAGRNSWRAIAEDYEAAIRTAVAAD